MTPAPSSNQERVIRDESPITDLESARQYIDQVDRKPPLELGTESVDSLDRFGGTE